jgi:MoaA/NifB/PqqE/SkfB family radical SAM enzyme
MPEENIQQIIDVLPGLEHLVIKGGEPFADENNLKILEELNKVNPTCNVKIISNCSNITDSMLKVLKERAEMKEPVKIVASVDGVDDLYYWIRSTEFNKTVETLEKIYNATNVPININITVSLYNVYNLLDIFEFFYNKSYVHVVLAAQAVQWPRYCSPGMLPLKILEELKSNIQQRIKGQTEYGQMFYGINYDWWQLEDLQSYEKIDEGIYDEYKPKVKSWITNMNTLRGMELYDIVPELRGIFN